VQDCETLWINMAQNGDDDAFGKLVEAYQTPVYNLCYRMLGNPFEAEDAAQESFFRAYKSLSGYDKKRPFSTWLLSISAHYCIDQIRRRKMKSVPLDSVSYLKLHNPNLNPELCAELNEDQQLIRSLLGTLSPIDRAVVVLFYWYDFSYDETAICLHLTVSAVKSRLHRARRELAKKLINQASRKVLAESYASCVDQAK
jgi:RNA polymerase sigma-70 factor, ECF subfamily